MPTGTGNVNREKRAETEMAEFGDSGACFGREDLIAFPLQGQSSLPLTLFPMVTPDPSLPHRTLQMVTREAPWFIERMETAKANEHPLTLALEEVDDNPILLYGCLWLSTLNGVSVLVSADPRTTSPTPVKTKEKKKDNE